MIRDSHSGKRYLHGHQHVQREKGGKLLRRTQGIVNFHWTRQGAMNCTTHLSTLPAWRTQLSTSMLNVSLGDGAAAGSGPAVMFVKPDSSKYLLKSD